MFKVIHGVLVTCDESQWAPEAAEVKQEVKTLKVWWRSSEAQR